MLTRMTDQDWEIVVQVFLACRSRRGAKGRNDRIFLEALHDFAVHNITWRALPEAFGNWNSIWKHYWRLSQAENEQELRILRRIRSWPHHRQIRPHGLTTRRLRTRIWIERRARSRAIEVVLFPVDGAGWGSRKLGHSWAEAP